MGLHRSTWWGLGFAGFLATSGVIFAWGLEWVAYPRAKAPAAQVGLASAPLTADAEGTTRLGESYTFQRRGVRACYLAGGDWARGLALGRLAPEAVAGVKQAWFGPAESDLWSVASHWVRVRGFLACGWRAAATLPAEVQAELAGLAQAAEERDGDLGRLFPRWLCAAVTPAWAAPAGGKSWEARGLAVAARVQATSLRRPLLACNLEFLQGDVLDREKIVMLIRPPVGRSFITIGWPGLAGSVSGMNDAGVAVVVLPGHASRPAGPGMAPPLAARRVLAEADSLDCACALIRAANLSAPAIFILGSGTENAFQIVEKGPAGTAMRPLRERAAGWVDVFTAPGLKDDAVNAAYARSGPSAARQIRLGRLVGTLAGKLDVPLCVSLLRDRRGPGGEYLGLGHPAAIDSLTAAQSLVFDLGALTVWVSAGPHALGEFVPFALRDFSAAPKDSPVPADPLGSEDRYAAYLTYSRGLAQGERLLRSGRYREALSWLQEVRLLNSCDYRNYLLAGRALAALGLRDEARYNYFRAKNYHPAFTAERIEIDAQLKRLREE